MLLVQAWPFVLVNMLPQDCAHSKLLSEGPDYNLLPFGKQVPDVLITGPLRLFKHDPVHSKRLSRAVLDPTAIANSKCQPYNVVIGPHQNVRCCVSEKVSPRNASSTLSTQEDPVRRRTYYDLNPES